MDANSITMVDANDIAMSDANDTTVPDTHNTTMPETNDTALSNETDIAMTETNTATLATQSSGALPTPITVHSTSTTVEISRTSQEFAIGIPAFSTPQINDQSLFIARLSEDERFHIYRTVFRYQAEVRINNYILKCSCKREPPVTKRGINCKCIGNRHGYNLVHGSGYDLLFTCTHIYKEALAIFMREAQYICCTKPLLPTPIRFRGAAAEAIKSLSIRCDTDCIERPNTPKSWNFRDFRCLKNVYWAAGDRCLPRPTPDHTTVTDADIVSQFPMLRQTWDMAPPTSLKVTLHFSLGVYTLQASHTLGRFDYRYQTLIDFHTQVVTRYTTEIETGTFRSAATAQVRADKGVVTHLKEGMEEAKYC